MSNTESFLEDLRKAFRRHAGEAPPVFAVLTLPEAARALGVGVAEVQGMLARGLLLSTRVGYDRVISQAEVDRARLRLARRSR